MLIDNCWIHMKGLEASNIAEKIEENGWNVVCNLPSSIFTKTDEFKVSSQMPYVHECVWIT